MLRRLVNASVQRWYFSSSLKSVHPFGWTWVAEKRKPRSSSLSNRVTLAAFLGMVGGLSAL